MTKIITIVTIAASLLAGCFTVQFNDKYPALGVPPENIPLIEEMSKYALVFCLENNSTSFKTESIAKRKTRKQLYHLGWQTTVTYQSKTLRQYDSTVIFEAVRDEGNDRYNIEYWYDFSAKPWSRTNDTAYTENNTLIKVNDRIYYKIKKSYRDRFPMM